MGGERLWHTGGRTALLKGEQPVRWAAWRALMQASDELLTIAELAIALAGFSGVVVAFAHQGKLTAIDRSRFAGLLSLSMGAAVVAFVPSLLHFLGLAGPALWRGSSVAFIVIAVLFLTLVAVGRSSQPIDTDTPRILLVVNIGITILTYVSQLSNALGWPLSPGPALLVFGLLMWLVSASMLFGLLVLGRRS